MNKNISYAYSKIRKDFGKQPLFCEVPVHMLDSILPDYSEQKLTCLRNPVNNYTQTSISSTEHFVNTKKILHHDQGVNHKEGGWSKEINVSDEEAILRYKRRIERDDSYINVVLGSYREFAHYLEQNNAIDMYTMYFKGMNSERPPEKPFVFVNGIFRDIDNRPIASIDWTNEERAKVVVSYCNKTYIIHRKDNFNLKCFMWDLDRSQVPLSTFTPPSACWQLVSSPSESSIIIGGLEDGRVCIFDVRAMEKPTVISPIHVAHREPVTALSNLLSRANLEFFTGSTDGKCMWWDSRNLKEPYDTLIICSRFSTDEDISLSNSEPISVLQYDRSIPTRFLVGTDTGLVINVNRKGKTHKDKMSGIFKAHNGSVKSLHRSPCSSKIFMTCGDWTVKIWNEDIHLSPILSNCNKIFSISDIAWAPNRFSSYMTISVDGKFRYWDLLRKHYSPVASLSVSKQPLIKMKLHEEGRLVAMGDLRGALYIVSLSGNLITSGIRDKQLMTHALERETRREHILEMRVKEIRLKSKAGQETDTVYPTNSFEEAFSLKKVEEDYKKIVQQLQSTGKK